jgi:hypothetical protein
MSYDSENKKSCDKQPNIKEEKKQEEKRISKPLLLEVQNRFLSD